MKNFNRIMETSLKNLRVSTNEVALDEFVVGTLEVLMQIEREEYLHEAKEDKGNGSYQRAFRSLQRSGLMINIPRTRKSDFSPATIELIKLNRQQVDDLTLSLYCKGMTSRDIERLLKDSFGENKSPTTITNLAKSFHEIRKSWENSELETHYKVIYCDVIFITVKRGNSYSKEGVFICYGVRDDGRRELLILEVNPTESAEMWGEYFVQLKKRGVESVDLVVADGLVGMEDQVMKHFFKTKFQKCVVHKMRNILNKTRPKEKAEMAEDLKVVFNNFSEDSTVEKAIDKLDKFCIKWDGKYPRIKNFFQEGNKEYYFSYIEFPITIRRMIYTTNSIENLNRIIRKSTKNKLSFQSPRTLLDYVFMVIKDFEDSNWMKYPVYAFSKINTP